MAIFKYKGLDRSGKDVKGSINSDGLHHAKQKIKAMGVMLVDIKEQKSDSLQKQSTISFGNPISTADLAMMTRQLATLIKAKVQIVEAFNALIDQSDNPKMRVVLSEIRQKVNEGSSLASSFGDYPNIFDNIYVNMVEAGESSGNLQVVLLRLADFSEAQVRLKNKIRGAMMYPTIMIIIGSVMMGVIFTVVIPKITKIFITMKKELPIQTKFCIWISNTLQNYWLIIIIALFIGYYVLKKYINTKSGKTKWHALLLALPVIGNLTMMINVSRFCSTLATLIRSGVPILPSLKIVKNLISNVHMQHAVEQSRISVAEGSSITAPLKESGHFPTMVTHMISIGEKSGEVEAMLSIIAENYEEQVDTKLSGLTSILEPIMILGMGGAVGLIIAAVVVPMMDLNSLS